MSLDSESPGASGLSAKRNLCLISYSRHRRLTSSLPSYSTPSSLRMHPMLLARIQSRGLGVDLLLNFTVVYVGVSAELGVGKDVLKVLGNWSPVSMSVLLGFKVVFGGEGVDRDVDGVRRHPRARSTGPLMGRGGSSRVRFRGVDPSRNHRCSYLS